MTEEGCHNSEEGTGGKTPSVRIALLIACLLISFSGNVIAQKKIDLGMHAGASYYMGDLNPVIHFSQPKMAIGALCRYNFNERNSLRFTGSYHSLSGNDLDISGNPRNFDASFVDLALNFEFNWKPYLTAYRKTKGSPYVFAGLGFNYKLSGTAGVASHMTFPFGAGYKLNIGRWLSGGIEAGPRRAFGDLIDGVSNPGMGDAVAPLGNRDWYIFTGVFVTYKIFKLWDDCPTYEQGVPRKGKR
jgi:hypothetical protein